MGSQYQLSQIMPYLRLTGVYALTFLLNAQPPHPIPGGFSLPNGWRITPVGKAINTEDLILKLT